MKLISHRAGKPPVFEGPSTTGTDGVNRYLSCSSSMLLIVKTVPSHAVPAEPVPVALIAKTSGSNDAAGQLMLAITPQLGTIVIVSNVMVCVACACVEMFVIVSVDAKPVWPKVTGPFGTGMSGLVPSDTPAHADDAPKPIPTSAASTASTAGSARRRDAIRRGVVWSEVPGRLAFNAELPDTSDMHCIDSLLSTRAVYP